MKIEEFIGNNEPTKSTNSWQEQRCKQLTQIGTEINTSRLEKCLSLEDMVMLTMIPQRLLQAIEEGDLNELPEPIYTQALIRLYADALGLDGTELANRFPIHVDRIVDKPVKKKLIANSLRPFHLYLLYTGLIFCSVNGLSQLLNTNSLQVRTVSTIQNSHILAQTGKTPRPVSRNVKTEKQPVQVGLTVKEKSWVRVIADGKVKYEGNLPKGYHQTWQAKQELTVRAGNAGGVLVSINQQQAKQMGQPGKVKEVKIAAKPRN